MKSAPGHRRSSEPGEGGGLGGPGRTRVRGDVPSEALPIFLLPVLTFVTGGAIAFATGTSWGTMAILLPIVILLAESLGDSGG